MQQKFTCTFCFPFPPVRSTLACELAFTAVKTVSVEKNGKMEIDIKRYARVEKVLCTFVCACVCVPVLDHVGVG